MIRSTAEWGLLQKGDGLVVAMTNLSWTVVGTGMATRAIRSGRMVEVDGSAGVVRWVS